MFRSHLNGSLLTWSRFVRLDEGPTLLTNLAREGCAIGTRVKVVWRERPNAPPLSMFEPYDTMPRSLDNRVAIITGAGRELGRSYARFLPNKNARVINNDLPTSTNSKSELQQPAEEVVHEIRAEGGGDAAVSHRDVTKWRETGEMIASGLPEGTPSNRMDGSPLTFRDSGLVRALMMTSV